MNCLKRIVSIGAIGLLTSLAAYGQEVTHPSQCDWPRAWPNQFSITLNGDDAGTKENVLSALRTLGHAFKIDLVQSMKGNSELSLLVSFVESPALSNTENAEKRDRVLNALIARANEGTRVFCVPVRRANPSITITN